MTLSRLDEYRAAIGGAHDADAALERCAVDGAVPAVVAAPASEGDVATALGEANACGLAVIPFGSGGHVRMGNTPAAYDVALSLRRLDAVVAYEPDDLTITLEAGVQLAELRPMLAEHNQFLPIDPPGPGPTIGGVVAANLFGPLRHAHGTIRDWVIGIRVAHADGRISKAGGRVVKNVTGYEMPKLYTGSLGTLGVITEVTLKVAPLPPVERNFVVTCHSAHAASTLLMAARDAGLSIHAAELFSPPAAFAVVDDARWSVLLRVAGAQDGVRRTIGELAAYASGLSAAIQEIDATAWARWYELFGPDHLSLRVSVAPSGVPETMEVLDRSFAGAAAAMTATQSAGLIRARLQPTQEQRASTLVERAREVAAARGGYVVVDSAPPSYKREHDVFGPLRPDFAIMKRLKDQFDPKRTLSPGRFVGRL